ncbi:MAG: hypothetical protein A3D67_02085 [Candidatus Lloydbacteria bacterium RIFCSPHIGHO2_02_FULL_51_22]|uniref:Uncharacterized protein n=3 Tax=Candidatus Lloydiibacteriota TaxID=1817910 RepID=A0A1G2D9X0_9BACT|nr:MAG: hypothetical protein A3D67_02085 [Candidatus Lloydbacteria bacterium RIFCSPHIGHO2_02_FULL_51_22]OGZ15200.1 MAG: hypothetical protein A3J08_03015 [Candidatus Lloydbacteria bacterium RIFCSPLOWO2_02_FULL_51_11]OGZ16285.1 MAG: hypothetical protein A3G11_01140 [Candidatus Lloydbacteria bacterium RIFCSPLOWO2_12_FULL_51_9]
MIADFLANTDPDSFHALEGDYFKDPIVFLREEKAFLSVSAPALLEFVGVSRMVCPTEAVANFEMGMLLTVHALRRFDAEVTDFPVNFLGTLSLFDEFFCATQKALLCNDPRSFYARSFKALMGKQDRYFAFVEFLSRWSEEYPSFEKGVYVMLELFWRREEEAKAVLT